MTTIVRWDSAMRVYLDNCTFNRPYDRPSHVRIINEANAKMAIQRAIVDGKLELAISVMLFSEAKRCPNSMAREYNLNFMQMYHKVYVSVSDVESIRPLIEGIQSTGIKAADATHIACAIKAECDYLITTDDRMLKYTDSRIKIISPTAMMYIMEV